MLLAAPVQAKKKDAAGPVIAMSDSFRAAAASVRAALEAGDLVTAVSRLSTLQPTSDFENYAAAGLRFEAATRRGDIQAQRVALTDMFKTASVPPADAPRLRYMAGLYSFQVGNYDDAVAQLNYARTLGYTGIDATMLMADIQMRRNKPREARPFVDQLLAQYRAAGRPIPAAWYDRAIALGYQSGDWAAVGALYRERLAAYPSTGNWRSAIANYLTAPGMNPQVQLDLYRLQAAVGAMASERDFQAYASLAERSGHNAEAKAIIEAGRAAGKLVATQTVTAGLMKTVTPKAAKEIGALPALARKATAAGDGSAAAKVADEYFSLSQFPKAVEFYRLALAKGGVDAGRVNSRLGVALARSGDLANARTSLAQANGEWANVAGFWAVWVDQQARQSASSTPPPVLARTQAVAGS
ncbi:hypothetical protein WG908_00805 [Sphingobium sp. AN641]|uniref:tetratricopeptide repeat protein n=1 Tax=Sphingobium sp. AN641 TaxID=3133443 RepID=UPI0030BCD3E0